jgi:hypothetical protein
MTTVSPWAHRQPDEAEPGPDACAELFRGVATLAGLCLRECPLCAEPVFNSCPYSSLCLGFGYLRYRGRAIRHLSLLKRFTLSPSTGDTPDGNQSSIGPDSGSPSAPSNHRLVATPDREARACLSLPSSKSALRQHSISRTS